MPRKPRDQIRIKLDTKSPRSEWDDDIPALSVGPAIGSIAQLTDEADDEASLPDSPKFVRFKCEKVQETNGKRRQRKIAARDNRKPLRGRRERKR